MDDMKIMMIASWYPSEENPKNGVFFQDRARAWVKNGCEVSVAAADVRLRLGGAKAGITVTQEQGVTEYRYVKRNYTPFWEEGIARQQIAMIRKIYERICRTSGKPDLIHLESARCAMAAVALAESENIPMTYTEHFSGMLNSERGSFRDKMIRLAVDKADHIFLLSTAMKNRIDPPAEKSSFLPNSIDFSDFEITERKNPFAFCALGGMTKIKGFDRLLHAFAIVQSEFPESRLILGGDGVERESLMRLCAELGLESAVLFPGAIPYETRHGFYHGASAFVCSSNTETFSIVTLEALASGVPVVATQCGGPEDFITERNGFLVEKNVDALAQGMMKMIRERERFVPEEIRRDAKNHYDEKIVVEKQLECFSDIIAEKGAGKHEKN